MPRKPNRRVTLVDRFATAFASALIVWLLGLYVICRGGPLGEGAAVVLTITSSLCALGGFLWPYGIQDFWAYIGRQLP